MANVNISIDEFNPQAGSDSKGRRESIFEGVTKAAQNDTITLVGATAVVLANIKIDATGVNETHTISGNVITLTSATTGTVSGRIIYR